MGMRKLFVFDLDGTALGGHEPYAMFPRHFARFLDRLCAQGIHWATNTTWAIDNQFEMIRRSGVKSNPAFISGSTGLALATIRGGKLVLYDDHARRVALRARKFQTRHGPLIRMVMGKLLRAGVTRISFYEIRGQNLLSFTCRKKDACNVWEILQPLFACGAYHPFHATPNRPDEVLLPHYMNKGEALGIMRKRLALRAQDCLAAGNDVNDLHMLRREVAHFMVCPSNSHPRVKEAVRACGGAIGKSEFSWGVVEGVQALLPKLAAD